MPRPAIPTEVDRLVLQEAHNRCGYCLSPQHLVMARLEIEHIVPLAKGGTNDQSNLWLACPLCNGHKSDTTSAVDQQTGSDVPLFNPRIQRWADSFRWSDDGLFVHGLTPTGRATVAVLRLSSDPDALVVRSYWIAAGWHPPHD